MYARADSESTKRLLGPQIPTSLGFLTSFPSSSFSTLGVIPSNDPANLLSNPHVIVTSPMSAVERELNERHDDYPEKKVAGADNLPAEESEESLPATPIADDDVDYPDGGLVAWLQVLSSHLMNCLAWGYASTFGVYQLYYTETMQLPRSQISWIGSIQIAITFAICTVSGRLSDAGYARTTVVAGSALAVFGTAMTSLAKTYWQILLAQGVCTGIGLGLLFMPGIATVSSYFFKKRAFALAVAATGTGTGSVIFPATVQYLIPQIGFPWAVRCASLVALVVCALSVVLLKPRLRPRKSGPLVEWEAFKEPPYVLFTLGTFFLFWALYFGFFYVSSHSPLPPSPAPCGLVGEPESPALASTAGWIDKLR